MTDDIMLWITFVFIPSSPSQMEAAQRQRLYYFPTAYGFCWANVEHCHTMWEVSISRHGSAYVVLIHESKPGEYWILYGGDKNPSPMRHALISYFILWYTECRMHEGSCLYALCSDTCGCRQLSGMGSCPSATESNSCLEACLIKHY